MSKWEITAGREVEWKPHTHWWVMTWVDNGSKPCSKQSPIHITVMDIGILVMEYAPEHAVQFGDKTKTAGRAGDRIYYLLPSNIWARMPVEVPKVPNVEMFFEKLPFPLTSE